ncbi:MAG TPA: LamG-like jellyroll fold domain-containing protein, partial [Candidatus Saccharimonadales bacterium]|nr:LamG-like jellyroll fold domain-containing protein [Candidatus Saccharimonadales bacterium]
IYINGSGGQEPIIFGGGEEIEMAINIATLADTTDDYVMRLGFCDQSNGTDCTDGLYFEYNRASSANWTMCAANNGTRTKTASSTAVATGWVRLKMVVNPAASQIDFYVNGTNIGTIASTNLPTTSARTTQPEFVIAKTAGTGSRTFKIDYFQLRNSLTTAR